MKKILLIIIAGIVCWNSSAQTTIAVNEIYAPDGGATIYDLVETDDGGLLLLAGSIKQDSVMNCSLPGFGTYIWMIKQNADGDVEWQRCYGGNKDERPIRLLKVQGGYVFCASTKSNGGDVSGNHGQTDVWVVKIDLDGNIIWQKCYGGSVSDDPDYFMQTGNGCFVFTANTRSIDGDVPVHYNNIFYVDAWICKIDPDGNVMQSIVFEGSGDDYLYYALEDDTTLLFCGWTQSYDLDFDNMTSYGGSSDAWLLKTDSNLNIIYNKKIGGLGGESLNSILKVNGGFLLTGRTDSDDGLFTDNHGFDDAWLLKLDSQLNHVWQKCIGGSGSDGTGVRSLRVNENFMIVSGTSTSSDGDLNGNNGFVDYWLIGIDSTGSAVISKNYGGTKAEYPQDMFKTNAGIVYLPGYSLSNDLDVPYHSESSAGWLLGLSGVTIVAEPVNTHKIIIYPNPADEIVNFDLNLIDQGRTLYLQLYNQLGERILSKKIRNDKEAIIIKRFAAGLYLYSIVTENGTKLISGNLIIQ